jgi:two-component system, NtrC family, nitrogen regulation sensor histidine kinase NtrY
MATSTILSAWLTRWSRSLQAWGIRNRLGRRLAIVLAFASLASGIATYAALTGGAAFERRPEQIVLLLNLNLVLLLLLGAIVARKLVMVWAERRRGLAGARLHVRLVMLFSLIALVPAVLVSVFSALFFNFGIQSWFSERVRTALNESLLVAEAYLEEHRQNIRADVLAFAFDLKSLGPNLLENPQRLAQVVQTQALLRSLPQVILFDLSGRIYARSGLTAILEFEPVPEATLMQARDGQVVVFSNSDDDRVRALVSVDRSNELFLYAGRFVDGRAIDHMERTQGAVAEYQRLEQERSGLQIAFVLVFGVVTLLLLLAAIWIGLNFATRLVAPISGLVGAAERVRAGDLTARVEEGSAVDELGLLSRAFNRMTSQLANQRDDLVEANRQLDTRRRFTEAVLEGVSAGVIRLDPQGRIELSNGSGAELLAIPASQMVGRDLQDMVPEMQPLLAAAIRRAVRQVSGQVEIERGTKRTLLVRISQEGEAGEVRGYVVTFDDVSELLTAQRKAAWADVARRIAHEIKNPLTPIQLSAERLKRKYLSEIKSDPETFRICTETIVRQVGDIGRMVDEFSAFARMPSPKIEPADLMDLCRQSVFLQRSAFPQIRFTVTGEIKELVACDRRQIGQAVTNLLKNAAEALQGAEVAAGTVDVKLETANDRPEIAVEDNGPGLPKVDRERLTEPYVTTRIKGTGLGLAIVKKIMEDHGGDLILGDRPGGGARLVLRFGRPAEDAGDMPQAMRVGAETARGA